MKSVQEFSAAFSDRTKVSSSQHHSIKESQARASISSGGASAERQLKGFALFIEMNKRLWGVVFPAICSQLTLLMAETMSMLFVGRMDNTYATAGVGIGTIFVNCTV